MAAQGTCGHVCGTAGGFEVLNQGPVLDVRYVLQDREDTRVMYGNIYM